MRDKISDPVPVAGDIHHEPGSPFHGAEIIHVVTRQDLLRSGDLRDASRGEFEVETRLRFKGTHHVAMAASVFGYLERMVAGGAAEQMSEAWGLVLDQLVRRPEMVTDEERGATLRFVAGEEFMALAHCGPGDLGEPVITVMTPADR